MGKNVGRLSFSCLKLKGAAPTQGVCVGISHSVHSLPRLVASVFKNLSFSLFTLFFLACAITSL